MPRRLLLLLPALLGALVLAACGGGGESAETEASNAGTVPDDAVAVVAGTPILKTEFDRFFSQAEKAAEARGETFPKAGTAEYAQLQSQAVQYLVQRVEFAKEAEMLGIDVTDAEVDKRLEELKGQFFSGDEQQYQAELKKQGLTDADVREDLRTQLIQEGIYDDVTKGISVTDEDVQAYYDENTDQFTVSESREVAHILVETKKEADDLYAQLQDGADFAALAKEHSTDTGSAEDGGKLTDEKGSFVPEFEEVAFSLDTGEIGKPVKSQFGWHIIKALEDTKPGGTTPFAEVKESIKEQLLEEKRSQAMDEWVSQVTAKYQGKVAYAPGFQPPASTDTSTTP